MYNLDNRGVRIRKSDNFPTLVKSGPMPVLIEKRRYITWVEALRLQKFPDNFNFGGTEDLNACARIGNAVCVDVISVILNTGYDIIFKNNMNKESDKSSTSV